ncbi:ABC transporter substrate-binding protein [Desulfoplanes formicivorans]|uniref:Taurine ABC transporter substrate-binding protein n=1 Tax=Desulfoplanes formicivorans TaxID=1592317 RepID=A0A194AM53_9BACT|nr:ABC transporter substrate-binding protein [Desulfoplanes formicivorans]GAU09729.1 taurine ABC transporter substrate-binding protein [Desulfoplanes formicivorans]
MKKMLTAVMAVCLLALLAGPAWSDVELKVAHATWVGYGPLYIAKEKGFFAQQGLDVHLLIIEDESQYAAAMASGNIDGLGNVLDREIIHFAKGTPEVVLFAMDESTGGDGIVASQEIKSLEDLKGKSVGLDKSSTSYFFFLTALQKAGVPEDSVTIHEMGASDAGAAFVAGRLDAAVTWEPWLANAGQREGGHVLVSSRDLPSTILDVFVLRKDVLDAHPEVGLKLTTAWNKAVAWYEEHPQEGIAIMAKAMGVSSEEMADMASGVTFFNAAKNRTFFDKTSENNIYEVAARAGKFWQEKKIITSPVAIDELITSQFVNQAAQ